ncbi:TetR/AcrR family transcriptional regulator [Sporolactobacillus sp. CPB3-1]|uniref:TetR/AcrR family transcriptional regulator n=1 Tax=Sporolactobacillus mangiferae TaxID=2940498 RepID=A0ABT0M9W1_9BACL|nr:TetR/AcrR family transcriptional regulator [Sporolactobacillus mangiferae]MCL1631667.1 TetR/AcrR family transcriptional regulator [Sporolactobacillus mangiferae]
MKEQKPKHGTDAISTVILKTTEALADRYGIDKVSMHQIAQTAGVGQGTIYRRYANKGALCMELMDEKFRLLQEHAAQIVGQPGTVHEKLKAVLSEQIHFLESHVSYIEAIHDAATCEGKKQTFYESRPYRFLHQVLRDLLNEAITAKTAKPMNTDFTAHTWIASINPKVYLYLRKKKRYSEKEIVSFFTQSFIDPLFL